MSDENKILGNIEKLGKRYCEECLNEDTRRLETNWWEALRFLLGHLFMRGRRDELSVEYHCFTIEVLKGYFSIGYESLDNSYQKLKEKQKFFDRELIRNFKQENGIGRGNSIKHPNFRREVALKNPVILDLLTPKEVRVTWGSDSYSKKVHLGNDEDVMMVLDVLRLISQENKKNVYRYLKETIANNGAKVAYEELKKIRAVSDKLATFVIRDLGLLNPDIIRTGDYEYAFPVDT